MQQSEILTVASINVAIPPLSICYTSFRACCGILTCTILWFTLHLQLFLYLNFN